MTHLACSHCRLRFTAATGASAVVCPVCGRPPQPAAGAKELLGFALFVPEDGPRELPDAVAVSIAIPDPAAD